MAKVKGTHGNIVDVQILGVNEVMRMLQAKGHKIKKGADFGVVRAGTFVQEEVKESIMGNRAEHKSVDTGRLANSIEFNKTGEAQGIVKPKNKRYPKSSSTTEEVATILELGTSRIDPRRHFGNTEKRNRGKVKDIIEREIKTII